MSQSVSLNHAQPDAADLVAAAGHLAAIIRDRRDERPITTLQYARLVWDWIAGIRLDPSFFETHSLRRTKATPIYRRTGNLGQCSAVGTQEIEITVRYIGIEVDEALAIAEQVDI